MFVVEAVEEGSKVVSHPVLLFACFLDKYAKGNGYF